MTALMVLFLVAMAVALMGVTQGLRKMDSAPEADLVVAYHAAVSRDLEVSGNRAGPSRWASAAAPRANSPPTCGRTVPAATVSAASA